MGTVIPLNNAVFALSDLVRCLQGQLLQAGSSDRAVGVSTDSRRVQTNNIFVALAGERFDGHDHASAAAASGASVLIVSRPVDVPASVAVVRVGDTLEALGLLGREHRRHWTWESRAQGYDGKVVAITGSAGKTTTCRAVTAVLRATRPGEVHSSVGNLNNAIGMPLVLLGLEPGHGQAVVEIGTNSPGEIAYGAGIVEPDVSVLTLVACAHTQGLGSIESVAQEKGELFAALGPEGVCVANADDPHVQSQVPRATGRRVIRFGRDPKADVRIVGASSRGWEGQDVEVRARVRGAEQRVVARVPLLGAAGLYATGAAIAAGWALAGAEFDLARAAEGLGDLRAEAGRLRPRRLAAGAILIDDAYNANPASMRDSIDVAAKIAAEEKRGLTLVLGEMRELGSQSEREHRVVGAQVSSVRPGLLVAVGGDAKWIAEVAIASGVRTEIAPNSAEAVDRVLAGVGAGDVVLVKGSRGVALERVVAALDAWGEGQSK